MDERVKDGKGRTDGKAVTEGVKKDERWEGQAMKTVLATGLMTLTMLAGSALAGEIAKPPQAGKPNYCVSPAVKQDRRRVFTASELRRYGEGYEYWYEAFFVTERDGAQMLVDPHIYQNLR